jgi:hypothetical protein
MRKCDGCGSRMAPFLPRTRLEDGSLVCKGCANRAGVTKSTATRKTAGWEGDAWAEESTFLEVVGVGEATVQMEVAGNPTDHTGRWEWSAFRYDDLPTRGGGVEDSLERAKTLAEQWVLGGQETLFEARKTAGKNPMRCPDGHEFYAEGYKGTCPECGKPASLDVEELNGLGLFLESRTAGGIPDHYRVLVLDRGEEVPIVVWSGHNPAECMVKAMEEHQDPDSIHVYIDRLSGAMGQYRIIWQDGKTTENFRMSEAARIAAEEDRSTVNVVRVPGQEGFHPTIQWDDSFGKWVCSGEGGRYATGNSPQVVLRTIKGRFGSGTTIEKKTGSRRVVAHDSGDGETIYHCPFCGAGQVTGRSDGTAECNFCKTSFTVQVQPERAAMPQTINGVPYDNPDMPGTAGPGESPVDEPAPVDEVTPVEADQGSPNEIFAAKRYFLTAEGVALPEDSYIRHLAIQHADDRLSVIAAVRAERGSESP